MNLNKIELCGFKSFADKTEIVFNTNITGIVGPNGCGKSNVIDAVRWVLGEMAPTTLRVGKMAELIFNGTEKRRSMSYCEVSLYLDNSDRKYDMDYEEVVVTRRLDRSGHSDYLLNRRVCTKSEIVELFRDTGIGKDGYSIIGQGKIDAILASSPEARRKIFEEAAGISSQKAKRIETERMLRDNRSNMERIYDLLSDIGQRLEPLQKAAEAATKARALKNELKFFEISQYLYQNENADAERKKCSDKLRKTDEELFNLQSDYSRVSDEYDSCMQAIKDGDKKLQDLNDEHLNKSLEATRAEGTGKNIARQLEEARDRIVRIGEERARSEAALNDKSAAIQTKILESEAAKTALEELKKDLEVSQKEYDELNKTIADKDKEIETWRDLYVTKLNQNAEIDKDTAQLATRKEILERDMGSAKDDYKARQSAVAEAEKQKEQLLLRRQELESQHKKAGDDLKEAKANFAAANNELIDLQRRRADLKTELVNVNFAIDNTEKFISDYADYEDSIQNLMSATQSEPGLRNKIIGTVAEIIQIPSKYTTAIGTVLGRAWQNIVTENEYDATDFGQSDVHASDHNESQRPATRISKRIKPGRRRGRSFGTDQLRRQILFRRVQPVGAYRSRRHAGNGVENFAPLRIRFQNSNFGRRRIPNFGRHDGRQYRGQQKEGVHQGSRSEKIQSQTRQDTKGYIFNERRNSRLGRRSQKAGQRRKIYRSQDS